MHGTNKDFISGKEKIKCISLINQIKIKISNFDFIIKEGIKERNPKWPEIND